MTQNAVKKPQALIPPDLKPADYARNRFLARPPEGTTIEDILKPEFWAHVARQFTPGGGDIVEVHPAGGAFYAELIVAECRKVGLVYDVRMVKLNYVPLVEEPKAGASTFAESEYAIVYRGAERKHTVTRKSDSAVISEGHATKQDAQKWLEDYELNKLTA